MIPCPRAALFPQEFQRAGWGWPGRPGQPGWLGPAGGARGQPGRPRPAGPGPAGPARPARPGHQACVCSTGVAGQPDWPGLAPLAPEKLKVKNVKASNMAATAAIFDTLTFLIFFRAQLSIFTSSESFFSAFHFKKELMSCCHI